MENVTKMKRMLGIIAVGTIALVACGGQEQPSTEASAPDGYQVVSTTDFDIARTNRDVEIVDLVHIETGCKFVMTVSPDGVSIEQVYEPRASFAAPDCGDE